ncbi:Tn3 family transposase, partial [Stutzerimonas stutzeri]|uniref:Tn3 family transposase n=1 Tax=Stutzerimonas stutzeri TaxID=316 RepID=UPI003AF36BE2
HRAGQSLDRAPAAAVGHCARPQRRRAGERRSDYPRQPASLRRPGTTYAKLAWLQAWHIRDETYGAALAELVNAQFRHPFAEHWG